MGAAWVSQRELFHATESKQFYNLLKPLFYGPALSFFNADEDSDTRLYFDIVSRQLAYTRPHFHQPKFLAHQTKFAI